uniref:Uncharacterized protein n=1 Tax=Opuntia streptacantha TaxID=393608 RepID=A0A7C9AUQ6_OPUST
MIVPLSTSINKLSASSPSFISIDLRNITPRGLETKKLMQKHPSAQSTRLTQIIVHPVCGQDSLIRFTAFSSFAFSLLRKESDNISLDGGSYPGPKSAMALTISRK